MEITEQNIRSGEWYEHIYSTEGEGYNRIYIKKKPPPMSDAVQRFRIDFALSIIRPAKSVSFLDCGAGVGFNVKHLHSINRECYGVEISKTAVEHSVLDQMIVGSMTDLSMFKDDSIGITFSTDVIEHLYEDDIKKAINEMMRVSSINFHYIGSQAGDDPGHVTIKTPREWDFWFRREFPDFSYFRIDNPIMGYDPLYVVCRKESEIPLCLRHKMMHDYVL